MAKHYFRKELVSNAIYINGEPVRWELVGDNRGLTVLDESDAKDQEIIGQLDKFASAKKLGVIRIDAATYKDLKKKASSGNLGKRRQDMLRVFKTPTMPRRAPTNNPFANGQDAVPAGEGDPTAATVPPKAPATTTIDAPPEPAAPFTPAVQKQDS